MNVTTNQTNVSVDITERLDRGLMRSQTTLTRGYDLKITVTMYEARADYFWLTVTGKALRGNFEIISDSAESKADALDRYDEMVQGAHLMMGGKA